MPRTLKWSEVEEKANELKQQLEDICRELGAFNGTTISDASEDEVNYVDLVSCKNRVMEALEDLEVYTSK